MPHDSKEVLSRPVAPPSRTVRWGQAAHEVYDVYEPPPRGPAPTSVVLVHGGFWRAEFDRTHLRPLALGLAEVGYLVSMVEYRRIGMAGGGWPGTCVDTAEAFDQVVAREGPGPHVLVGHSAGGQLALWVAHQPGRAEHVAGVVSLAGCLDLTMVAEHGLDDGAAVELMGGRPDQRPGDYALADPVALGPAPVPVRVVHGLDDDRVPVQVSRSWWRRAGTPGRDLFTEVAACDHFALIDPESAAWPVVQAQVLTLTARSR